MLERILDIYRLISNAFKASTTLKEKDRKLLQFSKEDIKYLCDYLRFLRSLYTPLLSYKPRITRLYNIYTLIYNY